MHTVIVDEWHELMGNKRGVQVQLALARLQRWNPALVVWGLSATLGNLHEAMHVLLGGDDGDAGAGPASTRRCVIDTLLPDQPGPLPVGRPPGPQMLPPVVERDRALSTTTLVFTNMRSQAEIWYQLLLEARPEWAGLIALHHGSLDRAVREWVELGLKDGRAEGGGRDLVAGPGRRLPAGRARAADRLAQGRGAAAAARRPQRPRAGAAEPHHAGADPHARAGRGGGRAARRAGRPDREARARRASRSTCWCSTW